MKTLIVPNESVQENWYIIDATDQVLGRLATRVASVIRGKNETTYSPHQSPKNHVIVINTDQIRLTGNKWADKKYYRHTGHPGGIKEITAEKLREKDSTQIITKAVKGMLPKNRLGNALLTNLRVYNNDGGIERHKAQKPQKLEV